MQNWATAQIDPHIGEQLGQLLLEDDLTVVWALFLTANTKDLEPITSIILKFFDQHDRVLYLVEKAITREIQTTSTTQTLFRLNNFASKLISTYCKRYGLAYISVILNSVVETVCLSATNEQTYWSVEMDPKKFGPNDSGETNQANLENITQTLLDNIYNSVDQFPEPFRKMCAHLRREAEKKFPGEYPGTLHAAVGGFVFLRYICPAIVVPQKYGLLEMAPGPNILRHLLLLSKVVQTVANGVLFGQKEAYMMTLNPFIEANQLRLRDFLVAVSDDSALLKSSEISRNVVSAGVSAGAPSVSFSPRVAGGPTRKPLPPKPLPPPPVKRNTMPPGAMTPVVPGTPPASRTNIAKPLPPIPGKVAASAEAPSLSREAFPSPGRSAQPFLSPGRGTPAPMVNFDASQLVGLMQYLALYWQDMRKTVEKMDDNPAVHLENYVLLSNLLTQMGVISPNVADKLTSMDKKTKKQEKAEKKRLDKERKKVMHANGQKSGSSLSRFNPLKSSKK